MIFKDYNLVYPDRIEKGTLWVDHGIIHRINNDEPLLVGLIAVFDKPTLVGISRCGIGRHKGLYGLVAVK